MTDMGKVHDLFVKSYEVFRNFDKLNLVNTSTISSFCSEAWKNEINRKIYLINSFKTKKTGYLRNGQMRITMKFI